MESDVFFGVFGGSKHCQSSCSPHSCRSHRIALAIGTGAADTGTVAAHEPVPPRVAALSPGAAAACRRCGATAGKPRPSREGANQSVASGHSLPHWPRRSARRGCHFNSIVSDRRDDIVVRANSCRILLSGPAPASSCPAAVLRQCRPAGLWCCPSTFGRSDSAQCVLPLPQSHGRGRHPMVGLWETGHRWPFVMALYPRRAPSSGLARGPLAPRRQRRAHVAAQRPPGVG